MATANPPQPAANASRQRSIVVVPCYNEAARLDLGAFERFLQSENHHSIGLLFVNDGSLDTTLEILGTFQARFPERVSVLDQQPNRGKAEAVRNGMLQVIASQQAAFTGYWDADLATPLDQIRDFLKLLEERSELNLVFGARVRLLGRAIHRQAVRHYLGRCFATVASVLLRLPIYDTQCGAKLFRVTPDLAAVLREPFHSRWIFDVEILARFLALQRSDEFHFEKQIYEYPLPVWTDVAGSKVKPTDFLRAFGELATIYRRHLVRR
jgi:glycosyltransferase involved in cell wall biosynthesis